MLILVPQALVLLVTRLQFPLLGDEVRFHLPSILVFSHGLQTGGAVADLIRSYQAASGPLPYLLFAAWGRLLGLDPVRLRWLSVLFAIASLLVFYEILRINGSSSPVPYSLLFATWPYFFLYSNTLLVHSIHLFFTLATVLMLSRGITAERRASFYLLTGTLLGSLAILTRQTALPLMAALYTYLVFLGAIVRRPILVRVGLLSEALFLGIGVYLFGTWGGLVPPAFQGGHRVDLSPEAILLLGISVAFFFFPILRRGGAARVWRASLLVVAVAYIAKVILGRGVSPISSATGIIPFGLEMGARLIGQLPMAGVELLLAAVGLTILWNVVSLGTDAHNPRTASILSFGSMDPTRILQIAAVFSIAGALFTDRLYELYLIAVYPWLLALSTKSGISNRRLLAWVGCQFALGIAYFWARAYAGIG